MPKTQALPNLAYDTVPRLRTSHGIAEMVGIGHLNAPRTNPQSMKAATAMESFRADVIHRVGKTVKKDALAG